MKCHGFRKYISALALAIFTTISLLGLPLEAGTPLNPLSVKLLKIGRADGIIVRSNGHAMIIDTGEVDDGPEIVKFLKKRSIKEVDAIIITHYDKDHVGGANAILRQIPVKTVYVPDYQGLNPEYMSFLKIAEEMSIPIQKLREPVSFRFVDAEVLIDPPTSYNIKNPDKDYDNNFSLITTIIHGKNRLVFTGDAEKRRLREWLRGKTAGKCNFLKVPHHGVYNKALRDFFATLRPECAVICCSEKNPAEPRTMELLEYYCPKVYQTKDGNVTITSDGVTLASRQKTEPKEPEIQQGTASDEPKVPQEKNQGN